jgi:hypothetical protein
VTTDRGAERRRYRDAAEAGARQGQRSAQQRPGRQWDPFHGRGPSAATGLLLGEARGHGVDEVDLEKRILNITRGLRAVLGGRGRAAMASITNGPCNVSSQPTAPATNPVRSECDSRPGCV